MSITRVRDAGSWLRSEHLSRAACLGLFLVILLVAASRAPYVLGHGRFWAEEGVKHFRDAWTTSFPGDLLFVYPNARYYNLLPNVGTWIASEVPLRHAPLVTSWLSFGVIAWMIWVTLAWPSELLPNVGARVAAAVLLVVGTLAEPVVWLNTLHVQIYLAVIVLLLLFVRIEELGRVRYSAHLVTLAIAGLSGLYAAALAPLYCVRAFQERSRRRIMSAAVISSTALVQVVVVLGGESTEHVESVKATNPGFEELVRTILVWHFSAFAFGQDNARELMKRARGGSALTWLVVVVFTIGVIAFLVLLLRRAPRARVPLLLGGAFVLIEVLVQLGSFGEAGGRYAVLPIAILILLVVHGAATAPPGWLRTGAIAACGVVFVFGVLQFWTRQPARLRCDRCPEWDRQVEQWEADPDDPLVIWPYDDGERGRWRIELPP
jgi:hypothetical protein